MSQHDYIIDNASGAAVRADLNTVLQAILSANSGASAPSTTSAYMLWADTTTNKLKIRSGADDAWFEIGSLDANNLGLMLSSYFPNVDANITATEDELNILDGCTATATELNKLDGCTASTAELNKLDGVTATTSELNILDGVTSTASELNILDGCTATTTELNLLDGAQPVLQVISTTDNTHRSTTSTTLTNSGISVSITPSSTSSKILVLATVSTGFSVVSGAGGAYGLRRESTDLGQGTSGGNRRSAINSPGATDNNGLMSVSMSYLDSPSTTDETTYYITYSTWGSYTAYINRTGSDTDNVSTVRGSTTLTLMEVAG